MKETFLWTWLIFSALAMATKNPPLAILGGLLAAICLAPFEFIVLLVYGKV